MKKNFENFHEILPVSKHSHSEVGFILVISLGPEGGWGSSAAHAGGGGVGRPREGGASAARRGGGASEAPPVLPTLSLGRLMKRNNYQNGQEDCLMGVSQGTVFGRVQPRIWNSEKFHTFFVFLKPPLREGFKKK